MVLGRFYGFIGKILGEDKPHIDELQDPVDFESGVFLDCAISWVYVSVDESFHVELSRLELLFFVKDVLEVRGDNEKHN